MLLEDGGEQGAWIRGACAAGSPQRTANRKLEHTLREDGVVEGRPLFRGNRGLGRHCGGQDDALIRWDVAVVSCGVARAFLFGRPRGDKISG